MEKLSASEARAIALTAQGFAKRGGTARSVVDALGVVQIDSVNVLARSHYLPLFARIGQYQQPALDRLLGKHAFEYWGHEASLLPMALHPLFRWRMASSHKYGGVRAFASRKKQLIASVLAMITERGPTGAGDLELGKPRRGTGWWSWSDAKIALEYLFWSGAVTTAERRSFERLYDLSERVIPAKIYNAKTPAKHDAIRALVEHSALAMGVATAKDLADYYRLPVADTTRAIHELELIPVEIPGWPKAWRHPKAKAKPLHATALLSPFDNLIWFRERTERMFGMRYRIEIYVPAPKRVHGYYVLPFLFGDQLVARIDLKADRATKQLLVQAAHPESDTPKDALPALANELAHMAAWLGLDRVTVVGRGDLAAPLRALVT